MAKEEKKYEAGKPAKVWKEDNPGGFPVKDPAVLKGIKESVKGMEKGRANQARFQAWGKGIDYDAVEAHKAAQEKNG
jgi:hypothetical protein